MASDTDTLKIALDLLELRVFNVLTAAARVRELAIEPQWGWTSEAVGAVYAMAASLQEVSNQIWSLHTTFKR